MVNPAVLSWPRSTVTGAATLLTFWGADTATPLVTAHTFSAVPVGPAATDRLVVVAVSYRTLKGSPGIDSVTVGGVAATEAAAVSDGSRMVAAVFHAVVPAGTTANIIVAATNTIKVVGYAVWSGTGVAAVVATGSSVNSGMPATLTAPAGAFTVSISINEAAVTNATCSWSGIEEVSDLWVAGGTSMSAAATAETGALAPTATWTNALDTATVAVSYK